MATYTDLLEQLTSSEKARFAAERQAEQNVRQAEAKVTALTQRLAEMRRANEQQLRELRAHCEKKLRDTASKAKQQVNDAEQARACQEGKAQAAEERMEKAEKHTANLEVKVQELDTKIQNKSYDVNEVCQRLEREAEDRIERISAQCNQRVNDMSQLCQEVQQAAASSMDIMAGEHSEQLTRADMRAEGRSRFRELCHLSKQRGDLQMSQREYESARADLTELWHKQCTIFTAASPGPDMEHGMEGRKVGSPFRPNTAG